MSLASMIAKQVVKATGDMFKDADIQKAISAQVDDVLTSEALQGKDGQDYLVRMTKAMLNDDPNFKPDVDRDPNLGLYLEVEHKLFSGNPGMRDAYHAAKINNAKLPSEGRKVLQRSKGEPLPDDTLRPYAEVPRPATYDEMFSALTENKKQKINLDIPEGSRVGLRLDIPAYTNYNTWVPTIHLKGKSSHRATASIRNVDLMPSAKEEQKAEAVMMGGAKSPFAKISGNLINRTDEENYRLAQEALNDPSWTQVGFNPDRHSYYFDRATGDPIIAGDEAIQVGPLVLVKNAVREERKKFRYAEGGTVTRTIKRGDTLSKISKETGVSISDLVKLNNIENPDLIRAGDTLILKEETKPQAERQPNRREIRDAMQRGKPDRSAKAFEDNVLREEPKRSDFRQLSGIRAAAIRRTKAEPTESRSLTTRSRQRPKKETTNIPDSIFTSTPIKTFVTGLFSSPVLEEDFLRVDEYNTLKDLAKGAIERGRSGLSYRDYNKEAGSRIGYKMKTPTEIATDPFQALKFTLGKAEIVRDGDKVVVADEFDFSGDDNISEQSVLDKVKFLAERTGQYFSDDISAYGLAHSIGEVFNPEGSGPSFRIGLGSAKDLGISDEQFAGLPTLEDYNSRYAGRIKQRMAKGGKIDKKKMKCNKPRRTPSHPKKSHVVKACKDGKEKIIRFGEQGAKTAGKPKAGESARMKAKRKSFKARHRKNIKRGNMSAAYWADKVKW